MDGVLVISLFKVLFGTVGGVRHHDAGLRTVTDVPVVRAYRFNGEVFVDTIVERVFHGLYAFVQVDVRVYLVTQTVLSLLRSPGFVHAFKVPVCTLEALQRQFVYAVRHTEQSLTDITNDSVHGNQVVFGDNLGCVSFNRPAVESIGERRVGDELRHVRAFSNQRVLCRLGQQIQLIDDFTQLRSGVRISGEDSCDVYFVHVSG